MICTNCNRPIQKGESYHRTKAGPHHGFCPEGTAKESTICGWDAAHYKRITEIAPYLLEALEFALKALGEPADTDLRLAAVLKGNAALAMATETSQVQEQVGRGGIRVLAEYDRTLLRVHNPYTNSWWEVGLKDTGKRYDPVGTIDDTTS
jgi:hypothetical protein